MDRSITLAIVAVRALTDDDVFQNIAPTLTCAQLDEVLILMGLAGRAFRADELLEEHLGDAGELCDHWDMGVGVSPTVEEYINDLMESGTNLVY